MNTRLVGVGGNNSLPASMNVVYAIEQGYQTKMQIATFLGISKDYTKQLIKKNLKEGVIKRVGYVGENHEAFYELSYA